MFQKVFFDILPKIGCVIIPMGSTSYIFWQYETPSRTPVHFLPESLRFHFQDLVRQCIILSDILEDLGRKSLILRGMSQSWTSDVTRGISCDPALH